MIVRPAEPYDIEACIELGRALHQESPRYRDFPYNEDALYKLGELCLTNPDYAAFVAERDGEVVGVVSGALSTYFFCNLKFAADFTFYVKPECRGTSAAFRLLSAFSLWAKIMGCHEVRFGVTTAIKPELADRLYTKMGFVREGVIYLKNIED